MAKNKKQKINKSSSKYKDLGWIYLIPLMVIVGVLPLIVFGKVVIIEGLEMINWRGGETNIDFFSYYKSIYFIIFSFLSVGLLILLKLTGQYEFKKSKYYIPLLVYGVFVVISYFMSEYKIVATRGFVELFQGIWVLLGYAFVVVAVINTVSNEKQVRLLIYAYIFVGVATGIIGAGQYFGLDIFKTEFGKLLILPETLHHIISELQFKFSPNTIYATMYNTNFVGSFAAILLPLAISLFMYADKKRDIILAGAFLTLMELVWIGSNSRAGYVGFACGFIFIAVLFRKNFKKNIKKLSVALLAFVLLVVVMNSASGGKVLKEFGSLDIGTETERLETTSTEKVRFEDLIFDGFSLTVVTKTESMKILYDGNQMTFEDEKGELLAIRQNGNKIKFSDEKYSSYAINMDDNSSQFKLNVYNQSMDIFFAEDGFRMLGTGNVLGTTQYPDRVKLMDGYERFASSRGYIWSRSVPLLKDTLLVGYGPDMFAIKFPQHDYIGKINAYDNPSIIVDKPHNLYLQIGINTGVVSLLALLAVFGMYIFDSLKLYVKRDISTYLEHIGVGAVTGVIAYLGAAFFNDQIISVAPLFYVMIGLGIAVNYMVKKQKQV